MAYSIYESVDTRLAVSSWTTGHSRNYANYSNPDVDRLLEGALGTINDEKRAALLAQASRIAMADYGVLPLHFEMTTWAMRKELAYTPRVDQNTQADLVKHAP